MTRQREETEAQFIVRRMTEIGFHPSPGLEADRVTFFKDYADDIGRRARVYVFFDKPIMDAVGMRLSNFVVNVQATFEPVPEAIAEAPPVTRGDLVEVIESFTHMVGLMPDQSAMTKICIKCRHPKASFFIINKDAVCTDCVEERKRE